MIELRKKYCIMFGVLLPILVQHLHASFEVPYWVAKSEQDFPTGEVLNQDQAQIMKEAARLPDSIQQFILSQQLDLQLAMPLVFTRENALPRAANIIIHPYAAGHFSSSPSARCFSNPILSPGGSKILIPTYNGLEVRAAQGETFLLAIPEEKNRTDIPAWSADGTKIVYHDHVYDISEEPIRHYMEHKITLKQYLFINLCAQQDPQHPFDPQHPHPSLSAEEAKEILDSFHPKVKACLLKHPVLSRYPRYPAGWNLVYCTAALCIGYLAIKFKMDTWIDRQIEKIKQKMWGKVDPQEAQEAAEFAAWAEKVNQGPDLSTPLTASYDR